MSEQTPPNIGPSSIAQAGTEGGPGFVLSKTEWISIQTYVTDALSLPINDTELRNSLGAGAPSDLSDFDRLIAAYKGINEHCTTWQKSTFPTTVDLASDVYDYGMNKVPIYYPPILKEAGILKDHPDDQGAKQALKAILDNLQGTADGYAKKATAAREAVQNFAEQSQSDQTTLVGPDGKAGLVKYYNDKYGAKSKDVQEALKEITAQTAILKSANEEYNHDVTVAATTPTYAWVVPYGTIAAAVVAGVYGHRAVEALDRAKAAQAKIDTLNAEVQADFNLMQAVHIAQRGMSTIVQDLAAALPVIQKIEGVWGAITADLQNISKLIDDDIRKVPPIIMDLGVDEARKAWHKVAQAANNYRLNAYVKSSGTVAEMETWRVQRLVSSRPAA